MHHEKFLQEGGVGVGLEDRGFCIRAQAINNEHGLDESATAALDCASHVDSWVAIFQCMMLCCVVKYNAEVVQQAVVQYSVAVAILGVVMRTVLIAPLMIDVTFCVAWICPRAYPLAAVRNVASAYGRALFPLSAPTGPTFGVLSICSSVFLLLLLAEKS